MYERLNKGAPGAVAYRITAPLTRAEAEQIADELEGTISAAGKISILIDLQAFPYADLGSMWEDLKFDVKHLNDIHRLALVGGNRVEQWSVRIFAGLTLTSCRCFPEGREKQAWAWLTE